jgi:hypothetical protein
VGIEDDGGDVTVGVGVAVGDGVGDGIEVGAETDRLGVGAAGCEFAQPTSTMVAPKAAAATAGRKVFMVPSESS